MNYLILLFAILFFILAWRRLDWAVRFLIATLPAYLIRFNVFGLPSTLLEVMIWAVFMVWFIRNFSQIKNNFLENFNKTKDKIKIRYPFDWEIVLLLIVALAAAGVAGFSSSSLGIWKAYFFEPAMLFIVVINVMTKKPPLIPPLPGGQKFLLTTFTWGAELVLWPLVISALLVSLLAIYQKITGQLIDNALWAAADTRRVVSFFGYPNAVGLYLGPIVLVMAGWLLGIILERSDSEAIGSPGDSIGRRWRSSLQNDKIKIVFIGLVIVMSVLSIYFAKSKGALLGVAAGLIVFGLLAGKKARWATAVIILIVAGGLLFSQPARRLSYETVAFKTLSGQIRLAGWSDTWRMLQDGRILTGAGLANYQAAVALYHTPGIFIKDFSDPEAQRKLVFNEPYRTAHWQPLEIYLYPHNIVLNFWSELGLAGLLLFVWIILKYFWMGRRGLSWRGAFSFCHPRAIRQQAERPGDPGINSTNVSTVHPWIPACAGMTKWKRSLALTDRYIVIGLISAMVAIVVHGLVDVPYFKNDLAVMFWMFVAMMSVINLENKYGKNL